MWRFGKNENFDTNFIVLEILISAKDKFLAKVMGKEMHLLLKSQRMSGELGWRHYILLVQGEVLSAPHTLHGGSSAS